MAWGTMPAPRAHGRHAHQVRAGYGPEDVGVRGLVRADCKGLGGSPSMASFEALEGGLLRRLWFILRRLLSSNSYLV